jgi:multisubunit Na+/H+ antiporter MnhF subunit
LIAAASDYAKPEGVAARTRRTVVIAGIGASAWLFGSYINQAGYAVNDAILTTVEICIAVVLFRLLYVAIAGETWTERVLAGTALAIVVVGFLGYSTILMSNPATTAATR